MARNPTGTVAEPTATSTREVVKPDLILDPVHPNARDAILDFANRLSSPDARILDPEARSLSPVLAAMMGAGLPQHHINRDEVEGTINDVIRLCNKALEGSDLPAKMQKEFAKRIIADLIEESGLRLPPATGRVRA